MKMAVFWNVVPYSLVEVCRRFRGICCLHHQGRPDDGSCKYLSYCVVILSNFPYFVTYLHTLESSCSNIFFLIEKHVSV
jgi:hypothetical protein